MSAPNEVVVTRIRSRVFELRVDVTGYLPGELQDWPAHIQDAIYAAMERVIKITKVKKLHVLQSRCGRDVAEEPYHIVVTVAGQTAVQ